MIIDTRKMTRKAKTFDLIVDNGTPEGEKVRFTVAPLSSQAYFELVANRDALKAMSEGECTAAQYGRVHDVFARILEPAIEPATQFAMFKKTVSEFDYARTLDAIAGAVLSENG